MIERYSGKQYYSIAHVFVASIEDSLFFFIHRCPPAFDILLRILSAYTAASKSWLHEHAYTQNCISMATPESLTSSASHVTKQERDELCIALTAAQESAIIQLLLEICLPTDQDKKVHDRFY